MAIIIRSYHSVGVTDEELKTFVGPAIVVKTGAGQTLDIQTPDDPDSILTLDEYMLSKGFEPGSSFTAGNPAIWVAPAPSSLESAVNRLANGLALLSGTIS
jgi:hypothetical protein